jgi:predicted secreted protein
MLPIVDRPPPVGRCARGATPRPLPCKASRTSRPPFVNVKETIMKNPLAIAIALASAAAAAALPASAATSSGTLTVTGTIESSISLTIESAGGTTSGTGTDAATSALGSVSKYGAAPTGFTLARGASNWTLSSTVGVKVDKANLTSTDYTLTAQLGSAPASGLAWKLNGSTLSDSAATTLTSTGTYGSTGSYSWDIVVADSAAAAALDNAIAFTATSN